MVKMKLDQSYLFAGKHYGPGEVDVPDDAAEAIKARQSVVAEAVAEIVQSQQDNPQFVINDAEDQPKRGKK